MIKLLLRNKATFSAAQIVVEFQDLIDGKNLKPIIEEAYGPKGLGILFVNNIPNYAEQRKKTLLLFHQLANLPKETLKKYERPDIFHSQGWSCGIQQFHGNYDISKGSYYVNCVCDTSHHISPEDQKYFTPFEKNLFSFNKWVDDIPAIQTNVKLLSRIMMDVGALLALQIDAYAQSRVPTYPTNYLNHFIKTGRRHIGRMLHYYPYQSKGSVEDDLCGWHNDHGLLTALTSALYTDEQGKQVSVPFQTGGLYAKNRFAEMAKISIPNDMLAFQLGQSTQIFSGGYLQATPHCVIRSQELAGKKIGRNVFVLFMDPDPLSIMQVPKNINPQKVNETAANKICPIKIRWDNGIFFKQFHRRTINHHI